jgi:hypothetical protein
MAILCRLGQHQAAALVRANNGASFGHCLFCGCDLILTASGWRTIPKGYRVTWRSEPPARAADPAQLPLALADLPGPFVLPRIARPAAPLPRRRAPRTGRRILVGEGEGHATA